MTGIEIKPDQQGLMEAMTKTHILYFLAFLLLGIGNYAAPSASHTPFSCPRYNGYGHFKIAFTFINYKLRSCRTFLLKIACKN